MYLRPRVIPCLLLDHRDLVKTVRFAKPRYLGDPVNAVKIFNNKGVDELCILNIRASRDGTGPDMALLAEIASEAFMPLSYGGGISSIDQIRRLFSIGYEKVILNTALVRDPDLVREAVAFAGSQSIVASIDARTDRLGRTACWIRDGTEKTGSAPAELSRRAQELGAGEILLNSINQDGTMQGYDLKLIRQVAAAVTIPVIACGGARDTSDFRRALSDGGAHAVAAGSLFVYYGPQKAVLITAPSEQELIRTGIYGND
ncbi:MAG: imidazole glycerol phosphate synthase subunit HisF [Clostridia bacterium]|nr:imidazole glycerol phosphate synthase subunit HisF [Clostridia bacterium]